ncbi:phospholipase D family protein [Jeotgalibacillus aurantiacus]|uniref:phospholipase D family protein n=1 Tax=Jeotgalibacillus aurantiacus TaxID=2763266 RepID=UPI001D09DD53|nr:phospholipase D family protein [Jeotgalibacillus aurantiacus]
MKNKQSWWKKKRWIAISALLVIYISVLLYHQYKPLPEGISYESSEYQTENVQFFRDLTYEENGERVLDHEIFNRVEQVIEEAEEFIVIDIFMIDGRVNEDKGYPDLAGNLRDQLLMKKEENPDLPITVITDPVNTGYGSYEAEWLVPLEEAGINVVITNLDPLRDSTPLYSTFWRMGPGWFGQGGEGWIANPFVRGGPEMTLRSYLMLGNVKANHRKAVITEKSGMVLSANAHNESGFHNNVAYEVSGPIIQEMLNAEQAVINLSDPDIQLPEYVGSQESEGPLTVKYVTEGKTYEAILSAIEQTEPGDEIWMAMFYLAEPEIVNKLEQAVLRDVEVSLILDPNETAFGNKKTGLPNRPVIHEMLGNTDDQLNIRWYNVDIEQFHPKMIYLKSGNESTIISGSANFTARNLTDYNLENNMIIKGPSSSDVMTDTETYFNQLWHNEGAEYTVPEEEFQGVLSFWQRGVYAVQKALGLTTY